MENLSLQDQPRPPTSQNGTAHGGAGAPPPHPSIPAPQGPPQLPPQMFTTAAQLLDLTDKKLLLVLRDGRKLIGVLRSWDQFANLILTSTVERLFAAEPEAALSTSSSSSSSADSASNVPHRLHQKRSRRLYCDIPRGMYLVRGENVLLLGEVDLDKDDDPPPGYELGEVQEVFRMQREAELERKRKDRKRVRNASRLWGGEVEGSGEVLFY